MDESFEVPADGHDIFRNFVVPLPAGATRWVRAWEFRPGNAAVVHHATVGFDATGASRDLDARDAAPGYEGIVSFSVQNPDGYFLGWSPGQSQPQTVQAGMAWPLPLGADLLISMHLRPTGRTERVRASIAFYFTDEAPSRTPVMLRLGRQDIDIPAGAANHTVTNSYRLPMDVDVVSVYPHAHHLARQTSAYAVQPDGRRVELLLIRDWDFNWQDVYRYAEPVRLRAGTTLTMAFTYDNSRDNPQNPHRPPTRVTFGPNSTDEMGDLWVQVVPVDASRRQALIDDFERKLLPETLAGVEMMLRTRPNELSLRNDAGLLNQRLGRFGEARAHFEHALLLAPRSAAAHGNLASVLLSLGMVGQAERYLQQALVLDTAQAAPHYLLGIARQLRGDRRGAVAAYRQALQRQPRMAEAHHLLAAALDEPGNHVESDAHYREAIRLRPDWLVPRIELAWSLATRPAAGPDAVRLALAEAEAATAMARTVATLDTLGAALARAGDFERAVSAATEAARLARAAGDRARAIDIDRRLEGYRLGRPFVQLQ
jgi:Flp pilus assembly protein TadD